MVDPEPEPTVPTVTAINGGTFHSSNGNIVTGANMRFEDDSPASHVVVKDNEGNTRDVDFADDSSREATEESFGLVISPNQSLIPYAEYTFEFRMVDSAGHPVTVTCTARWDPD